MILLCGHNVIYLIFVNTDEKAVCISYGKLSVCLFFISDKKNAS